MVLFETRAETSLLEETDESVVAPLSAKLSCPWELLPPMEHPARVPKVRSSWSRPLSYSWAAPLSLMPNASEVTVGQTEASATSWVWPTWREEDRALEEDLPQVSAPPWVEGPSCLI